MFEFEQELAVKPYIFVPLFCWAILALQAAARWGTKAVLPHSKRLQGGAWQSGVYKPVEPCPGTSPRSPVCPVSPLGSQPESAFTRLPALRTSHTSFFCWWGRTGSGQSYPGYCQARCDSGGKSTLAHLSCTSCCKGSAVRWHWWWPGSGRACLCINLTLFPPALILSPR